MSWDHKMGNCSSCNTKYITHKTEFGSGCSREEFVLAQRCPKCDFNPEVKSAVLKILSTEGELTFQAATGWSYNGKKLAKQIVTSVSKLLNKPLDGLEDKLAKELNAQVEISFQARGGKAMHKQMTMSLQTIH